jgi:hypothetical protein
MTLIGNDQQGVAHRLARSAVGLYPVAVGAEGDHLARVVGAALPGELAGSGVGPPFFALPIFAA